MINYIDMTKQELIDLVEFYRFDDLTGLMLRKDLNTIINNKIDNNESFNLIIIDINDLHSVNKKGMDVGDKLIKYVSSSLIDIYGIDNVFRYGGDEFIVICDDRFLPQELNKMKDITFAYHKYDGTKKYSEVFNIANKMLIEKKNNNRFRSCDVNTNNDEV